MLDLGGSQPAQNRGVKADVVSTDEPSRIGYILAGVLVLLVALVTISVFFIDRSVQAKSSRLQTEYTNVANELTIGKYAQISRDVTYADMAGKALLSSVKQGNLWSLLLKNFQATTAQSVRLQSVSVNEKNELKLDGEADTFADLSTYLATLQKSQFVKKVELISAGMGQTGDQLVVQFSVGVQLTDITDAGGAQ